MARRSKEESIGEAVRSRMSVPTAVSVPAQASPQTETFRMGFNAVTDLVAQLGSWRVADQEVVQDGSLGLRREPQRTRPS